MPNHLPPNTVTIAIIGAGFSGTVIAARLLRATSPRPIRVVLINRQPPSATPHTNANDNLGRGLAYGTKSDLHLLNVPCGRMSAFPEDEDDFLNFLLRDGAVVARGDFVSRRRYGEYLRQLLDDSVSYAAAQPTGNTLQMMAGEVTSLQWAASGQHAHLQFAGVGASQNNALQADRVVLALGNFAPANLANLVNAALASRSAFTSPRYVNDPWAVGVLAKIDISKPIILIGTGLTMLDIVLTLSAQYPSAQFIALSRRGLLPQAHRATHAPVDAHPNTQAPVFDCAPENILQNAATARTYVRAVRGKIAAHAKTGGDWRDVIASLRPITPQLWQRLPIIERARLLRHVKPYWESHRHRAAPQIADAVAALISADRLSLKSAQILAIEPVDDTLRITIRPRHQAIKTEVLHAATIINCTGPTSDFRVAREALLCQLETDGMLRADANRLGIAVNHDLQVLDQNGDAQANLYCVGPLLKADFWEATAVPELREHAKTAAENLLRSLAKF